VTASPPLHPPGGPSAGIDAQHLLELGKLAVAAGVIEGTTSDMARALITKEDGVARAVLKRDKTFQRYAQLVHDLLPVRLGDEAWLTEQLEAWLRAAKRVYDRRNNYLHQRWIIDPSGRYANVLSHAGELSKVPLPTLKDHVLDAEEVASDGADVYFYLLAALGFFPQEMYDEALGAGPDEARPDVQSD